MKMRIRTVGSLLLGAAFFKLLMLGNVFADQAAISTQALEIAQKYVIVDTHIDVPYRIEDTWADVTGATENGDFDYPRATR